MASVVGFYGFILLVQIIPDNIAAFYLSVVKELMGCPVELVTDLGTENAIVAAAQNYF